MNSWWWVPIGLAAWFVVAVVMALCIGSVLRRSSQTRESLDQQLGEISGGHTSPGTSRRCALHVEAELDDVAVTHDVVLALDAGLARGARGGQRAGRD